MKTIGVRDFLKGGYKDSTEPLLVMSHSKPVGIWRPTSEIPHFVSAWAGSDTATSSTFVESTSTLTKK